MPRLTWKDGDTHEFVVIGKEKEKRHYDRKNNRAVLCTGPSSCWWCQHGYQREGVSITVPIRVEEEIEGSHYPRVFLSLNAYSVIRKVLGLIKFWYGHKIALTREGTSFDTRYTAQKLGKVGIVSLVKWEKEREAELVLDAGEDWGEEAEEEEPPLDEEVVYERGPEPEEEVDAEVAAVEEVLEAAKKELEELKKRRPKGS